MILTSMALVLLGLGAQEPPAAPSGAAPARTGNAGSTELPPMPPRPAGAARRRNSTAPGSTPAGDENEGVPFPERVQPVLPTPAIEAPRQPERASQAQFRVTPRVTPASRAGTDFQSRVKSPVRSLVAVRGLEENHVRGLGIVTGLNGTGDSGQLAAQLLANSLLANNVNIDPALLATSNVAVVRVEATIPPGAKPGQKIDVRVSSMGDSESLVGGELDLTELTDITGRDVYATAAGPLTVGGFAASGAGATVQKNHVTVATLASGGTVQAGIETSVLSEHGYIYLDAKNGQSSLGNTVRIAEAINQLYPNTALVLPDGTSIRMSVLDGVPDHDVIAYLDRALNQEVETDNLARVVINERTGVIVMGGDVRLRPGVIHHGTIVVTVAETPEVSQPGPLSQGETVELPRTALGIEEQNAPMVLLGGASSLEEVVEVLNVLGATPRDMIAILEAMLDGGLLIADLRRI